MSEIDGDGTVDGTIGFFDSATRGIVAFDARDLCRQEAALSPDPAGDMTARFFVENGVLRAEYFEETRTIENGGEHLAPGAPIPPEEAARRLAEQRAARDW